MQHNFGLSLVLIVSATMIDAGANGLYVSASNADPGDGRKYSLVTSDLQAASNDDITKPYCLEKIVAVDDVLEIGLRGTGEYGDAAALLNAIEIERED